jgi:hypothetical protein
MKFSELEDGQTIIDELRALKLDIRETRLEAREQYNRIEAQFNRFRLLIWLPIVTSALQVLAVLIGRR